MNNKLSMFSSVFLVIILNSCWLETLTGSHSVKIVNDTIFTLSDIEMTSVFNDGKSKANFSKVYPNSSSDAVKLNDVLSGSYQVGFKVSAKLPTGQKTEIYSKDDNLRNPIVKIEKIDSGEYEHTLTFSGDNFLDKIKYEFSSKKK